ncbi:MAG TPA: methyltransferase domain-containing protein [Myxococcota bacterium]|nr:methyltransferase domain-containing protein [Myxococcota bacterium]
MRIDDEGGARSLVVDETFASFYRPGEIATLCVWDAIAAPLLWLPPRRRRRILVLGLGGGSVARLARALAPEAEITGIELDPEVVRLARAHLDLDALDVRIEVADALVWLEKAAVDPALGRGRFDAILEDVFIGHGDDVHKPDWIPEPAHALARDCLARGGLLVSNTLDEHARVARSMRRDFESVVAITVEDYDNRVLVAGGAGLTGAALRARVAASPVLGGSLPILGFRTI